MHIHIKRIYSESSPADGLRVLVDRLWPRGVARERAAIDVWPKELTPSTELRRWFGHDPARFEEFGQRYRAELAERPDAARELLARAGGRTITLLYAARDPSCNHALVLQEHLRCALA